MSVGTLSSQQLRSLVEDRWKQDLTALAMGLHVARPWKSPNVVEFDFGKAHVVRADTVFQVREALLDAERSNGRIILLTKLRQGDLGNDVVARLARSRLFANRSLGQSLFPVQGQGTRSLRLRFFARGGPPGMCASRWLSRLYPLAFSTREQCGARPVVMCSRWANGNRTW